MFPENKRKTEEAGKNQRKGNADVQLRRENGIDYRCLIGNWRSVCTLAARGMHVILVARTKQRLRELAQELVQTYNVRAEVIPADLSQEHAAWAIQQEVQARGLTVDMLINNAGFGAYGHFTNLDPQRDHAQVMVNVTSVVDLTHAFLPAMVERQEGATINVSSLTAFQSFPYMAIYPASKAFVLSLSEALTAEYEEHGVRSTRDSTLPRRGQDELCENLRCPCSSRTENDARADCGSRPQRSGARTQFCDSWCL